MRYNCQGMLYATDNNMMKRITNSASQNSFNVTKIIKELNPSNHTVIKEISKNKEISTLKYGYKPYSNHIGLNTHAPTLEKQLLLHEQLKKYAPHQSFEINNSIRKSHFLRKKKFDRYTYVPCCVHESSALINNTSCAIAKNKFTKRNSMCSSVLSAQHSGRNIQSAITRKIVGIANEAEQELREFERDIKRNNALTNLINQKKKASLLKKHLNLNRIRSEFNFDKMKTSSKIDQSLIMMNNYKKLKGRLDKNCKRILKNALNQIKYEDSKLNKTFSYDFMIQHMKTRNKQRIDFEIVAHQTLKIKRQLKGPKMIHAYNEERSVKKLINEMLIHNLNDEEYLQELLRRKNIFGITKGQIEEKSDSSIPFFQHNINKSL